MSLIKGVLFARLWLPTKITLEAEHLDNDKWRIKYSETMPEDTPPEDITQTKEMMKDYGIELEVEGNIVRYEMLGTRNQVFGIILGEAMIQSDFGKLTIAELSVLALTGIPNLMKKEGQKPTDAKEYHGHA